MLTGMNVVCEDDLMCHCMEEMGMDGEEPDVSDALAWLAHMTGNQSIDGLVSKPTDEPKVVIANKIMTDYMIHEGVTHVLCGHRF